jgi:hypothetical protein
VRRCCAAVRVSGCHPDFLQEFIARRLEGHHGEPALAARVRALDAERVDALKGYVLKGQALARGR